MYKTLAVDVKTDNIITEIANNLSIPKVEFIRELTNAFYKKFKKTKVRKNKNLNKKEEKLVKMIDWPDAVSDIVIERLEETNDFADSYSDDLHL